MESLNLALLQQFPIQKGTNRYLFCRVAYPVCAMASSLVHDDTLSQHQESTDEDNSVEGDIFVYAAGSQIYTVELKEPSYVHKQQLNMDFQAQGMNIECLTAFPLPMQFSDNGSTLPLCTGILVVLSYKQQQQMKLYGDHSKEIPFNSEQYNRRNSMIIWINSKFISTTSDSLVLLLIMYSDQVGCIYHHDFRKGISTLIKTLEFEQQPLYSDIFLMNHSSYIAIGSFDGEIHLIRVDYQFQEIEGGQNEIVEALTKQEKHLLNRVCAQPKLYTSGNQLNLMVPIQGGQLLRYDNVIHNNLTQFHKISYPNANGTYITAFDIQEKKNEYNEQFSEHEVCLVHFDGKLQIYEMVDNVMHIQLLKQMNHSRYFIFNLQLQFKQFIIMASDDEMEIFQMSFYQIN